MNSINVTYKVEVQDLVAFNLDCPMTQKSVTKITRMLQIAFSILVCVSLYYSIQRQIFILIGVSYVYLILVLWFWIFGMNRMMRAQQKSASRLYKSKNKDMLGKVKLEINEKEIVLNRNNGKSTLSLGKFIRVAETDNHFYLYLTNYSGVCIPKRNSNQEDLDSVVNTLLVHRSDLKLEKITSSFR